MGFLAKTAWFGAKQGACFGLCFERQEVQLCHLAGHEEKSLSLLLSPGS